MSHHPHDHGALDTARERGEVASDWWRWYDDAATLADEAGLNGRIRLLSGDLGRITSDPLRERIRRLLDVEFERLLDAAPPALAHRLAQIAAAAGHYRYSWPLARAAAHALPPRSRERPIAIQAWRLTALEAHAWSAALEAIQMLAREAPLDAPFPSDRYEPLRILGVGGFAEVYLCRDRRDGAQVVVNALARKQGDQWPRDVFHEVRLLEAIQHEGVSRVRDSGYVAPEQEVGPYCALDYFDGLSLHQYIEECGALSWMNLRGVLRSVLETLDAAHSAGVLHCDLKPGNILLRCDSRGWQTQLIDFGIGVWRDRQTDGARDGERRPGTVGFSAPEQLGVPFASAIHPAADVYALGQTAIFALTREPPGKWHSERVQALAGPLAETLLGCVQHDPRQRPRVEQLRRYLQQIDLRLEPPQRDHESTRVPSPASFDHALPAPGTASVEAAPPAYIEPITGFGTVMSPPAPAQIIAVKAPYENVEANSHKWLASESDVFEDAPTAGDVDCTVFAPPSLALGDAALAQVFVHFPYHAEEVQRLASGFDPSAQRLAFKGLMAPVTLGSVLTFTLVAPGLIIDDPVQQMRWSGRPESVQFGLTVPRSGQARTVLGTVQVAFHGVPLGCLRFRLAVTRPSSNPATMPAPLDGRLVRYGSAFTSYSSRDRDEVLKRVQMLRWMNVKVFQDVLDLEPGQRWERELYRKIDECDLFLLFWSSSAKDSEWVGREVRYALDRQARDGDMPQIVPVVLEGPPVPLPPKELEHLHFHDAILNFLESRYAP